MTMANKWMKPTYGSVCVCDIMRCYALVVCAVASLKDTEQILWMPRYHNVDRNYFEFYVVTAELQHMFIFDCIEWFFFRRTEF